MVTYNEVVTTTLLQHVRDQFCGDGRPGLVLFVHSRVGVAGDDSRDAAGRGTLAGGDEDEEFHEVVVHIAAARLDDEDVLVADALGDLDVDFSI